MNHVNAPAVVVSVLMLAACSSATVIDPGPGDPGPGDPGDPGEDPICRDYASQIPEESTVVAVVNDTSTPLYFNSVGCQAQPHVQLYNSANAEQEWLLEPCDFSCGALQNGAAFCADGCTVPGPVLIEPGGRYEMYWTAHTFEPTSMPEQCAHPDLEATSDVDCKLATPAAGQYRFVAEGFLDAEDCDTCVCDGGELGWCHLNEDARATGDSLTIERVVEMPTEGPIEVRFFD